MTALNTIFVWLTWNQKAYIVSEKSAIFCKKKRGEYAELLEQGRIDFITFLESYSHEYFAG